MLAQIRGLIAPPVFAGDEDKTRLAELLNTILLTILIGVVLASPLLVIASSDPTASRPIATALLTLLTLALLVLMRRGHVRFASATTVIGVWAIVTLAISIGGSGVRSLGFPGNLIVVLMAGILLGRRAAIGVAGLAILTGLVFVYARSVGAIVEPAAPDTDQEIWIIQSVYLVVTAVLLGLALRSVDRALAHARRELAERRQAQEALRKSEAKNRALIDALPDMMMRLDPDGTFLEFKPARDFEPLLPPEQFLGKPVEAVLPSIGQEAMQHIGRALRTGELQVFEYQLSLNDELHNFESRIVVSGENEALAIVRDITERKQMEEALRLARFTVERVADAVYWIDPEARIVDVNEAAGRTLGYTREELTRMSLSDIDPAFSIARWPDTWKRLKETGTLTIEAQHRARNGRLIPVEIVANFIEFGGRELDCAFVRDITERKRVEETLRSSEARYRSLFDNMLNGFAYCRMLFEDDRPHDFIYLAVNRAFAVLTGLEDVVGKRVTEVIPGIKESNPELFEIYGRVAVTGGSEKFETYVESLGIWFSVSVYSTEPGHFVATFDNITERKQAEEALRESEAKFRALLESASVGIVVIDHNGHIVLANACSAEMFGYGPDELLGQPVEALMPQSLRTHHVEHRTRFLTRPRIRPLGIDLNLVGRRKDGGEFPVEIGLSFVETKAGILIMGFITDVTERKRAEEEIHQLNANLEQRVIERTTQLEAVNKELEAFSYSVSHDLRAPLRAIDGFSRILLEDHASQLDAQAGRYLNLVREGAGRMGQLIDDLLAFSRLSRQPLLTQPVAPVDVVQQALADLRHEQAGRQVEIVIGELPTCQADPALLRQVYVNLLGNALKFTRGREPARIEIGCRETDGVRAYFVADNGTGFDMQYAHKLFGVFQRLHRAEEYEGTGVGLAIVQRIVQRHSGRAWAEAEPDRGATFYFTIAD
jgi:PAS domain S-box-containing protein